MSALERHTGAGWRTAVTWSLAHGVSRGLLRAAARRGDLIARLTVDPGLREDPFGAYETLRGRDRLVRGRLISATVDHALGDRNLRSEDFSVADGHGELPPLLRRVLAAVADPYAATPVDPPSMLAVDPPQHTRYRRLVSKAFTARAVTGMEADVRRIADELVDDLARGPRQTDIVDDFAALLPVAVITELLGLPADQRPRMLRLGNRAAITLDPGLSWRQYRDAEAAVRELHHWSDEHIASLRRDPGEDLLSRLAVMDGDDRLTGLELRATGLLLIGAGFETTVNLLGSAVAQLSAHPDQRRLMVEEPDRWANAVEEVLRYDSPVQLTARTPYADTELDGVGFRAGEAVLTFLGGANRDPSVFSHPQRFDVTRDDADRHLSFSAGVHYCLGASLARLEARVGLQTLYERFPDLAVSGTPARRGTRVLRGYEHLPVDLGRAS